MTSMELDDLKATWQSIDRRLEQQHALGLRIHRDQKLDKARQGLRPLMTGQILQIIFGAVLAVFSALFWTSHLHNGHFLASGIIMQIYAIAVIILGARTAALIHEIDYSAPVVAIQKQLARLRSVYFMGGLIAGLPWWFLWVLILEMLLGFAGADLARNAPSAFYGSILVGLAGFAFSLWLHRWSRNPSRPRLAKFINDSMTGASLLKAQRFLDEIAEFEQES